VFTARTLRAFCVCTRLSGSAKSHAVIRFATTREPYTDRTEPLDDKIMSWRLAESLKQLRSQINDAYPQRDRSSDGSIGDAKHSSRKSDHNPNSAGVVTAIDIDEDLSPAIKSIQKIVDAICASRDKRVKYIIYEGRITVKGSDLQAWKKYTGSNSHSHHAHISASADPKLYDDRSLWNIDAIPTRPAPADRIEQKYIVVRGDTLWGIARKFATSVDDLKRLNELVSDLLQVGQTLRVK